MIYLLTAVVVVFWGAVFLVFFGTEGTTPLDYLRGRRQPLPEDLGKWREFEVNGQEPNEVYEERYLHDPDRDGGMLTLQRRVRDRQSGDVLRVLEDKRVRRSRSH